MEDVFISYRRDGGETLAHLVRSRLSADGYTVFLDDQLRSGRFDDVLYEKIRSCTDFLVILTSNCLDRCTASDDWVRQEIEFAIKCGKNVIPVMERDFQFSDPDGMPESIREIRMRNGVRVALDLESWVFEKLEKELMYSQPGELQKKTVQKKRWKKEKNDISATGIQNEKCPVCGSENLTVEDRMMDIITFSKMANEVYGCIGRIFGIVGLITYVLWGLYTMQIGVEYINGLLSLFPVSEKLARLVEEIKDWNHLKFLTLVGIEIFPLIVFGIPTWFADKIRKYYYRRSIQKDVYWVSYFCNECGNKYAIENGAEKLVTKNNEMKRKSAPMQAVILVYLVFCILSYVEIVILAVPLSVLVIYMFFLIIKEKMDFNTAKEKVITMAEGSLAEDFGFPILSPQKNDAETKERNVPNEQN